MGLVDDRARSLTDTLQQLVPIGDGPEWNRVLRRRHGVGQRRSVVSAGRRDTARAQLAEPVTEEVRRDLVVSFVCPRDVP